MKLWLPTLSMASATFQVLGTFLRSVIHGAGGLETCLMACLQLSCSDRPSLHLLPVLQQSSQK